MKCEKNDPLNDQSPCNVFAAKGVHAIYGYTDFGLGNNYLSANQIYDYVHNNKSWISLGTVFHEDNNLCAQYLANLAYPVIAVMKGDNHGHVALIIPGESTKSNIWDMQSANSASFLYKSPEKSYVNKPLSNAFKIENAKRAEFFYRSNSPVK